MRMHPDVVIVGGGVIGLTTAYNLALEGVRVRVLERTTPGSEASWAGAGIIPPGNPDQARTTYDRLRALSSVAFPKLSQELQARTGIDNGYRVCGGIEVFDSPNNTVPDLWRDEGIAFEQLSPSAQQEIEPNARLKGAAVYHLPGVAQVRNPWHLRALIAACQTIGVEIEPDTEIVTIRKNSNRIEAVECQDGFTHKAGRYLFAAGAWTDQLLVRIGIQLGVKPIKGQMVLFQPLRPLIRRILGFDKRYLVPREDGRILVGSTEEPEAGFDKQTTDAGYKSLKSFAIGTVPELASALIEKTWAGLRPGSPDGLPFLGALPNCDNAFIAAGHYRAGIQLSVATGRIMCDVLQNRHPPIELEAFGTNRVRSTPPPMAFRS